MKRSHRVAAAATVGGLFAAGMAIRAVAHPCDLPSDKELDRVMFQLADGALPGDLLAAIQVDWPEVSWTQLDHEQVRGFHYVQVHVPASWTEVEWELFEESIEHGHPGLATWLEFLSADEAPEGGTGSTFVDGINDLNAYKSQFSVQTLGITSAHQKSGGSGTVVAILDTGVADAHDVLEQRVLPGWDFVDGDAFPVDEAPGQDLDGDGQVDEMAGHGTFVAGLVALVAPDARILPVRVLDPEGRGDSWALACGIWYAIDRGVEVINLSLGSTDDSDIVEVALEEAASRGIVVVAAAGNCDRTEPEEFPAMSEEAAVIGVAAVDDVDVRASFSNFHEHLAIAAPAVTIWTADGQPVLERSMISTLPDGAFGAWEGTSVGVPLVSGAVAAICAQHPEWEAAPSTIEGIRSILSDGAAPIDGGNPGYEGLLGAGRLNVGASVGLGPVAPRLGDLDADGTVGTDDLLIMVDAWGSVHSTADLNGSGLVDVFDLLMQIAAWG